VRLLYLLGSWAGEECRITIQGNLEKQITEIGKEIHTTAMNIGGGAEIVGVRKFGQMMKRK